MLMLLGFVRLLVGLLIIVTAVPAFLALFGFAVPFLDLFNHLQLLLFFGTLIAVVLSTLFGLQPVWRVLAIVGLLSSAWTFGPRERSVCRIRSTQPSGTPSASRS